MAGEEDCKATLQYASQAKFPQGCPHIPKWALEGGYM